MNITRRRVVLVEDDPDDLYFALEALGPDEMVVVVCRDGESAIRYLENASPPDVILLDLQLPLRSGWEVLESIIANPALGFVPVFILSTLASRPQPLRTLAFRIDGYLHKPLDRASWIKIRHISQHVD